MLATTKTRPILALELPNGVGAVRETLKVMNRLVRASAASDAMASTAREIIWRERPKSALDEIAALFEFVRTEIRYTSDPVGVERVDTLPQILANGAGDCDDQAALLAGLLQSVGYRTKFVAMGFKPGALSHVVVEVLLGEDWRAGPVLTLDASEDRPMGWRPPGAVRLLTIENSDAPLDVAGLGLSTVEQNQGLITAGLNAIPGVGPILSTVFNMGVDIFGGADKTPMPTYYRGVVGARLQLAAMRHALGIADDFHLPINWNGDEAEIADLALLIVNDSLHRAPGVSLTQRINQDWSKDPTFTPSVWPAYSGSNLRKYVTDVLKTLASQIGAMQLQQENAAATYTPPPVSTPTTSEPSASSTTAPGEFVAPPTGASSPPASTQTALQAGIGGIPVPALIIGALLIGLAARSAK